MSTDLRQAARAFTKAIDAWRTAPTKDERNNRLEDMWDAEQSLRAALSSDDGMVRVPREPRPGLLCGDVAVSTDPRYAGFVFVRHVDGINWTTCAKMTPETWAMLAAEKETK